MGLETDFNKYYREEEEAEEGSCNCPDCSSLPKFIKAGNFWINIDKITKIKSVNEDIEIYLGGNERVRVAKNSNTEFLLFLESREIY